MRTGRWSRLLAFAALAFVGTACSAAGAPTPAAAPSGDAVDAKDAADGSDTPASPTTDSSGGTTPATPTEALPPAATATEDNAAALDFSARRLSGGTLDGVQLAGDDVVLWMWAPWCPQCNREAPHVAEAVARYDDTITFVGIAGHDSDDAHRAFVAEHGLESMLTLVDDDGSLWARYGVSYQPAWVFVDEDGEVQQVAGGLYEDLDARLQALVDR